MEALNLLGGTQPAMLTAPGRRPVAPGTEATEILPGLPGTDPAGQFAALVNGLLAGPIAGATAVGATADGAAEQEGAPGTVAGDQPRQGESPSPELVASVPLPGQQPAEPMLAVNPLLRINLGQGSTHTQDMNQAVTAQTPAESLNGPIPQALQDTAEQVPVAAASAVQASATLPAAQPAVNAAPPVPGGRAQAEPALVLPLDGGTVVPAEQPTGEPAAPAAGQAGATTPIALNAADAEALITPPPAATGPGTAATDTTLTAAAPTRAAAPTPPLHRQLVGPIATLATDGQGTMHIRVAPDTLGPISLTAQLGADGGLRVELAAPTEAGRDALRAMLPELRRELAATGHGSVGVLTDSGGTTDPGGEPARGEDPSRDNFAAQSRTGAGPASGTAAGVQSAVAPSTAGDLAGAQGRNGLDVLA